jgi:hypothetical protein
VTGDDRPAVPDYATRTNEELAGDYEAIKEERRRLKMRGEHLGAEELLIYAILIKRLEDGEAVVSPYSGRVCFKAEGAMGSAGVNKDAIDEVAGYLPPDLQPRSEVRYPGVTAIRQAAKDGRLPDGVRLDSLLIPAPPGSVLRWRTLEGVTS